MILNHVILISSLAYNIASTSNSRMTLYLIIFGIVLNIVGIILVSFSVNKLVKNIFKNVGGYTTDWISLENHWIISRKIAIPGIIIIIIGFILQIIGLLNDF